MSSGNQRIKWRRNIAKNFNRLSRVHERYRQTIDDSQTDDRQTDRQRTDDDITANMNMSSRSLKTACATIMTERLKLQQPNDNEKLTDFKTVNIVHGDFLQFKHSKIKLIQRL